MEWPQGAGEDGQGDVRGELEENEQGASSTTGLTADMRRVGDRGPASPAGPKGAAASPENCRAQRPGEQSGRRVTGAMPAGGPARLRSQRGCLLVNQDISAGRHTQSQRA